MYELNRTIEMKDPTLVLRYGADLLPVKDDEECAGQIEVWLRPLIGEDERAISDALIQMNRKGRSEVKAGTTDMIKVCRSVVKMAGLSLGGTEIRVISHATYNVLDKWILDRLKKAVAKLNAELDDEAAESD